MQGTLSKRSLSEPRQRLIELFQQLNFGRIERLVIRNREPVFTPSPWVVREIKFGGDNAPRPELNCSEFLLRRQLVDLFQLFDRLGQGTIELLEVKHGLPFRALVVDTPV